MKTTTIKLMMAILGMLLSINVTAFSGDALIDGIVYHIVTKAKTATVLRDGVVYNMAFIYYGGAMKIPKTIQYDGVVCNVEAIDSEAFRNCTDLTSIEIPNSVKSIGDRAFYGCTSLTSIEIPNSVTSINYETFKDCKNLISVTIPNSVTSIGDHAFEGCKNLTHVHITDLAAWCNISFGTYYSNPLDQTHHLYLNGEEIKDLVIPSSVTSISSEAFRNCSGLTSVTISNSTTSIGSGAFYGCNGLTSVNITNLSAWCKLAFGDETSCPLYYAHHLYIAGVEVKDLVIPNSITSIRHNAFNGCSGLTSITIPNSVTSIGSSAFSSCCGLTSVTIPNSVTCIDGGAFEGCSRLSSVSIGNGVTHISKGAFSYCPDLEDVYCYAEDMPHSSDKVYDMEIEIFNSSDIEYATLHVPENLIETYKKGSYKLDYWAPGHHHDGTHYTDWPKFGKIVALTKEETAISQPVVETFIDAKWYTLDGKQIETLQKGVNIIKYKNGGTQKVYVK